MGDVSKNLGHTLNHYGNEDKARALKAEAGEGRAGRICVGCQGSLPLGSHLSLQRYRGDREWQSWKLNVVSLVSVKQVKAFCRVSGGKEL